MILSKIRKGWKELKSEIIDTGKCCLCGACAAFCESITISPSGPVESGLCTEVTTCKDGIGSCYNLCPMTGRDEIPSSLLYQWTREKDVPAATGDFEQEVEIIVARYAGPVTGTNMIGGGAGVALLLAALRNEIIDSVIMSDFKNNAPVIVTTEEGILELAKNMYLSSAPISAVARAITVEEHESVGVVGTGCEIQALRKMQNHPDFDFEVHELVTFALGTFCFFKPRPDKFYEYLESKGLSREHVDYVDLDNAAFKYRIKSRGKDLVVPVNEVFNSSAKISCFSCSDGTANLADISMGVVDALPGWNVLVVRTSMGKKVLHAAKSLNLLETKPTSRIVRDLVLQVTRNKFKFYTIESISDIAPDVKVFTFNAPDIANVYQPGQFIVIWLPDVDFLPMTVSRVDGSVIEVTVKQVGPGTRSMFQEEEGAKVAIRGPYGNGWDLSKDDYLIVGGGIGIAALTAAMDDLASRGKKVTAILGGKTKDHVSPARTSYGKIDHSCIMTEDGSMGRKGIATDEVETLILQHGIKNVITCGPEKMMKKVFEISSRLGVPVQASIERMMKCCVGLCGTCCVGEGDDIPVCKQGPVFDNEMLTRLPQFGTKDE
ncbi:MAG: dihydroorotate dehydrogenase electron transfer subunit [Promethearchaeota archaeon]